MSIQSMINNVLHNTALLKTIQNKKSKAKADKDSSVSSATAPTAAPAASSAATPASVAMAERAKKRLQERGEMALDQNKKLATLMDRAQKKKGSNTASRLKAALGQREKIREEVERQYGINKQGQRK